MQTTSVDQLIENLAEAHAELRRIYDERYPERIAHFGPMHGEPTERLQITTATDGDILSVVAQDGRLWLEVMRLRGQSGRHQLASLYLTPGEAEALVTVALKFVEASRANGKT